jgi:hypothetical protein
MTEERQRPLPELENTDLTSTAGLFFEYPGPKIMSQAGMGHFDPNDPNGLASDFVVAMAPPPRPLTAVIAIGADVPFQIRLVNLVGKSILSPGEYATALRSMPAAPGKHYRPLHPRLCRVRVTFPPGERVFIPKEWLPALRQVRNGQVVAGLCPSILFRDETRDTAPPLDPVIEESSRPPLSPRAPKPRRRTPEPKL